MAQIDNHSAQAATPVAYALSPGLLSSRGGNGEGRVMLPPATIVTRRGRATVKLKMVEMFVPDETGVITQVINSPVKQPSSSRRSEQRQIADEPVLLARNLQIIAVNSNEEERNSSDSEDDTEYIPHSEDSGEDSEVVELRKHARKFRKRMSDSKSWINSNAPVPLDLIANMEDQIGDEEKDWNFDTSDEDYSYDEDSDGQICRRKSKFVKFDTKSEIPHFALEMVFRSKNQLCKALRRYGIVTKRSIVFVHLTKNRSTAEQGQGTSSSQPAPAAQNVPRAATAPAGSMFKPPMKKTAQPGMTGSGPSTAAGSSTGAKRGRKRAASSIRSYSYFTCSGNY